VTSTRFGKFSRRSVITPVVDQYNDNVIKDIINVLGDLPWNAIDVIRIGYQFEDPTKYPVILWVSVQPGSTTWDKCYHYAINCTAVLRKYNIPDVGARSKRLRSSTWLALDC
jgi:hypothetical protein